MQGKRDVQAKLEAIVPLFQKLFEMSKRPNMLAPHDLLGKLSNCILNLTEALK